MKKIQLIFILFFFSIIVNAQSFNGFALYNSQGSNTTYLIDENQQIAHTWNMSDDCNYTVHLKDNGNLVRGVVYSANILGGAAEGGKVQEVDPEGNIVWEYIYSDAEHLSHHDLTLIGDNVLLTAWEVKSVAELSAAGFTGSVASASVGGWPTHFIELQPNGLGGADIIWEWHIWDHLCQDTDPNKPNYVFDISEKPERININMIQNVGSSFGPGGPNGDWFHINGVDYNPDLDQIVFSSRHSSEIYIIDHSTTTAQAADSVGGISGMGGDILYRWGNPSNYGMSGTQIIPSAVHDARWIKNDGRPNSGFLQIFNNCGDGCTGQGGPGGNMVANSTVDGIETPWDPATNSYLRIPNQAFGPNSYTTRYSCQYSASGQSASDRMSNGNIFVNASRDRMYELEPINEQIIWEYPANSPKAFRYECDHPGILALRPFMYQNGSGNISTTCFIETDVNNQLHINDIQIFPNPTNSKLNISFTKNGTHSVKYALYNSLGKEIYLSNDIKFSNNFNQLIDLSNYSEGIYTVKIISSSGFMHSKRILYIH